MNQLSVFTNTTDTMSNDNATSSINNLASDSILVSIVMEYIINFVKSHIAFSMCYPYIFLRISVTGGHISRCII